MTGSTSRASAPGERLEAQRATACPWNLSAFGNAFSMKPRHVAVIVPVRGRSASALPPAESPWLTTA